MGMTPTPSDIDQEAGLMPPLVRFLDSVNYHIFSFTSVATLFMVFLTVAVVVFRYGFNMGWIALQESIMYFHAIVFMLGITYTLRDDGHVRVDVIYRNLPEHKQHWINLVGTLCLLLPTSLFILIYSWNYVSESWRLLESSKEPGGIPLVFVLKSLIPAMAIMLTIQGVSHTLRYAILLRHKGSK